VRFLVIGVVPARATALGPVDTVMLCRLASDSAEVGSASYAVEAIAADHQLSLESTVCVRADLEVSALLDLSEWVLDLLGLRTYVVARAGLETRSTF